MKNPIIKTDAFGDAIPACAFCGSDAMRRPVDMLGEKSNGMDLYTVPLTLCVDCFNRGFDEETPSRITDDFAHKIIGFAS